MKRVLRRFAWTYGPLVSELTAFYCLMIFANHESDQEPLLVPVLMYFACGALLTLLNAWLAEKKRSLQSILGINGACVLLAEVALFWNTVNPVGWFRCLLAFYMFLHPALRSFFLIYEAPVDAERMLSYCELSVMGTGFFLLIQAGGFAAPPAVNLLLMALLILNIIMLSVRRNQELRSVVNRNGNSEKRGLVLMAAILVLVLLAGAFALLVVPATEGTFLWLLAQLKALLLSFYRVFLKLLGLLAGLFPPADYGSMELAPQEGPVFGEMAPEEFVDIPWLMVVGLALLLAAGVLFIGGYLFWRLRKVRISARNPLDDTMEKSQGPTLFRLLSELFAALKTNVQFQLRLWRHYHTCAGVFVRLERRGKRLGIKRQPGQTPREYLQALLAASSCPEESAPAMRELMDRLDRLCFAGEEGFRAEKMDPQTERILVKINVRNRRTQVGE